MRCDQSRPATGVMLATPMLTVVVTVGSSDQSSTLRRTFSATPSASTAEIPGNSTANSSPPNRAVQSPARRIGNADRNADQHLVAGLMAMGVVVGLEMVGVDHQQRDRRLVARRAPP